MPQLDPTWFASQLFWLAVSLVLLYLILSRLALPSLMAVLELRQQTREGDLARAAAVKLEAEQAQAEYERVLAEARKNAQSLFAEAEARNKQAADAAIAELNRAASAQAAEAERRIAASKQELLRAVEPSLSELVSFAVEKVTGERPDDRQVQSVIQQQRS